MSTRYKVQRFLRKGWKPAQIAKRLRITTAAVTYHMKRLRQEAVIPRRNIEELASRLALVGRAAMEMVTQVRGLLTTR